MFGCQWTYRWNLFGWNLFVRTIRSFLCSCRWCCLLILLGIRLKKFLFLCCNTLFATFTCLANLVTASFGLIVEHLATSFTRLLFVDVLHEDSLVLEHVTLHLHVELVVEMTIDFLRFTIFLQQTTKDTHTSHPEEFDRSTSIGCTLALAIAAVTTLSASDCRFADAETRVHDNGLLDDQTVFDQFADVLS